MTTRTWLAQRLANDSAIQLLVGDRVYEGESLNNVPQRPFIVYRMGNRVTANLPGVKAGRQYFLVYLHDEGQDYMVIDSMVNAVYDALTSAPPSPADHVLEARYIETSGDQDDHDMQTIMRYVRFLAVEA